jgi:hypothetical protein
MKWSYVWDANDLPEVAADGNFFDDILYAPAGETVTREILTGGKYHCSTTSGANASYVTKQGVFDCSGPSTVEWSFRNNSAVNYYTNAILIKQAGVGYVGFKFVYNHGCNPYEVNSYVQIYSDASYWSTIRILTYTDAEGKLSFADLFYKDADGQWKYGNTSTLSINTSLSSDSVQIGDLGGNWGGDWEEEYLMIMNGYATLENALDPDIDAADINGDRSIDVDDLMIFVSEWLENRAGTI